MEKMHFNGYPAARAAGGALLLAVTLIYVAVAVVLLCGGRLGPWIFPVCFVAALVWVGRCRQGAVIAAAVCVVSVVVASVADDYTFDGTFYHQEIVVLLLEGWNPYTGAVVDTASPWAMHYAKALETVGAAIASTTDLIESGKAVNLMLASAAAMLVADALASAGRSRRRAVWLTALAMANPVVVGQMLTYYVDWYKYVAMLITLVMAWRTASDCLLRPCVLMGCATLLAVGTKFNIFFEQGLALACVVVFMLLTHRLRAAGAVAATGAVAALAGVLLTGWHPYVTNMLGYGNPLYPLLGTGAADIMTGNTPVAVAGLGRLSAFGVSLLTVAVPTYDMRLGGFGPAMPLLLAVALLGVVRWRRLYGAGALCVMAYAVATCFIFGQAWWARYVCQLWLVVPVTAAALGRGGLWSRRAASVVLWLGLLTGAAAAAVAAGQAVLLSLQRHELYAAADRGGRVGMCNATTQACRHFTEQGIVVECLPDSAFEPACGMMFYGLPGQQSMPAVVLSDAAFGELRQSLSRWPGAVSGRLFDNSERDSGL